MDPAYTVFYDGQCRLCQAGRRSIARLPLDAPVRFVDLHDGSAVARFPQVNPAELAGQMMLIEPGGRMLGGFDALVALLAAAPLAGLVAPVFWLPPIRWLGRRLYRVLANHRYAWFGRVHCGPDRCAIGPTRK